jgi:hypothetical protein
MSSTTDLNTIDIRTEAFALFMNDYPYASEVDAIEELPLQMFTADDEGSLFNARVLGFGSSYRKTHLNHAPGTRPKGSCSRCRWTDTAIMWAQPVEYLGEEGQHQFLPLAPWQYVFVSMGKSIVSGERQYNTVVWTTDPLDVFRQLFVPTKKDFRHDTGSKAIPPHNAVAFRDASSVDVHLDAVLAQHEALVPPVDRRGPEADPLAGL